MNVPHTNGWYAEYILRNVHQLKIEEIEAKKKKQFQTNENKYVGSFAAYKEEEGKQKIRNKRWRRHGQSKWLM